MFKTLFTAILAFALAFFAVTSLVKAETTTTQTQTTTPGGAPQTGF